MTREGPRRRPTGCHHYRGREGPPTYTWQEATHFPGTDRAQESHVNWNRKARGPRTHRSSHGVHVGRPATRGPWVRLPLAHCREGASSPRRVGTCTAALLPLVLEREDTGLLRGDPAGGDSLHLTAAWMGCTTPPQSSHAKTLTPRTSGRVCS